MPFTQEQRSKGGQNSKRKANSDVEILRRAITGKLDISQLFYEIEELEINERVTAKLKLLQYILPRLSSVDLTATGEMTISQFISLTSSQQDSYLQNLINGQN